MGSSTRRATRRRVDDLASSFCPLATDHLLAYSGYMAIIKGFMKGFTSLWRGFTFLASHPRLWGWAAMPTFLNLLLLAIMVGAFAHYYGDIYAWLTAHVGKIGMENPSTWYWHIAAAILWCANLIFQLLLILTSLILLLILAYGAGLIIAGPFNDALSERVEKLASGYEPPPFALGQFVIDMLRVVRIESIKAAILIAVPIALFALNILPVVGGPLYIALTFVFGSWSLGFSYADLPAGRRVMPFRERWRFAVKNRWSLVGLGCGFAIPFFSLLCAAPMVVAGTLLYIDLKDERLATQGGL